MLSLLSTPLQLRLGSRTWSAPVWALLLALAGAGFFARLGLWQWERAEEKTALAARYEARAQLPPLSWPGLLARGTDIDDLPVRVSGRYDNRLNVYLENQPHGGRTGFHVHTVFRPDDGGPAVLVNRGWVPAGPDLQQLPPVPPATATELRATAARPSPFFTVGEPDYRRLPLRVGRLDIPRLREALGVDLQPFLVRLDAQAPDGFVREWTPAARLGMPPEKHRGYAFQWFALAATVLVVLVAVNLKKNKSLS